MGNIVPKTSAWFPNLEDGTAVRIAIQFGDKMVHYAHKPAFLEVTEKKRAVTSKDIHCIAYIGGYVIRNLRKKLSHKTIDVNLKEQYSTILDACLQKDNPTKQDGLVHVLTRGGLVEINKTLARLFEVLDSYFRSSLSKELEMSKNTNLQGHVLYMTNRVDITDKLNALIESCEQQVTNEICSNFLEDIVQMYFKIRCFSYTEDWLQEMKAKNKVTKRRALRTEVKKNEMAEDAKDKTSKSISAVSKAEKRGKEIKSNKTKQH